MGVNGASKGGTFFRKHRSPKLDSKINGAYRCGLISDGTSWCVVVCWCAVGEGVEVCGSVWVCGGDGGGVWMVWGGDRGGVLGPGLDFSYARDRWIWNDNMLVFGPCTSRHKYHWYR